jgi:alpha-pyrone synthase
VTRAWLNRIGTAVPSHDIHAEFVDFARTALGDARSLALFDRMADLADIEHRFSIFAPGPKPRDHVLDSDGFYLRRAFPTTGARMALFRDAALALARQAIAALDVAAERASITHLIVASCTGFTAPGLDFDIMQDAGLASSVERTIIGFMGCFAAVNALKLARHIVRSEPDAKVLVVNLELSSLHLQEEWELEKMLSFLLFGDGCGACLVSAEPVGLALDRFHAEVIPRTADLITWRIGDQGFAMHLSGQVPGCASTAPACSATALCTTWLFGRCMPGAVRFWMPCSMGSSCRRMRCATLGRYCANSATCRRPRWCSCWSASCVRRMAPGTGWQWRSVRD